MLTDWMEGVFDAIDKNYVNKYEILIDHKCLINEFLFLIFKLKTMYLTLFENEEKPDWEHYICE